MKIYLELLSVDIDILFNLRQPIHSASVCVFLIPDLRFSFDP